MAIELNKLTSCSVIGISHTGHIFDETIKNWQPLNVVEQINHKVNYIEKHLFNDKDMPQSYNEHYTDIVLIGHSIGCFIILETLETMNKTFKQRIKKAILLFPTIERMSTTPNGKHLTFMTKFFMWLIYFFAYLITIVPNALCKKIINVAFTRRHNLVSNQHGSLVDNAGETVLKMCASFSCLRSCLHMGRDEMGYVKKLNTDLIKRNLSLLTFYYGATDKWCPLDYYYDMQSYVSNLDNADQKPSKIPTVVLDSHGLEHAFVLYKKQCSIISSMIKEWIHSG